MHTSLYRNYYRSLTITITSITTTKAVTIPIYSAPFDTTIQSVFLWIKERFSISFA